MNVMSRVKEIVSRLQPYIKSEIDDLIVEAIGRLSNETPLPIEYLLAYTLVPEGQTLYLAYYELDNNGKRTKFEAISKVEVRSPAGSLSAEETIKFNFVEGTKGRRKKFRNLEEFAGKVLWRQLSWKSIFVYTKFPKHLLLANRVKNLEGGLKLFGESL